MFSGVSGLRTHQTMMDVLSSNIANVNTFGFKSQRTTFKDALLQNLSGAGAPSSNLGGTNARQVGLGMTLNSIDNLMTQGNAQSTGVVTDVAIQGDGYFRIAQGSAFTGANLNAGAGENFTRAGNFTFDAQGYLVTQNGYYVIGYVGTSTTDGRLQVNPSTTQAINVDPAGVITAIDNTGTATTVGTIRLAKFANSAGLERISNNMWRTSNNSGTPVNGTPGGAAGHGQITPGTLEMSNVDLALEFTNMIIAQRGFQANGKTITASDQMLEELVNLKR
ncbi:MAG: flagellar hook-basal body complex protein [Actinomycetota bacterium]